MSVTFATPTYPAYGYGVYEPAGTAPAGFQPISAPTAPTTSFFTGRPAPDPAAQAALQAYLDQNYPSGISINTSGFLNFAPSDLQALAAQVQTPLTIWDARALLNYGFGVEGKIHNPRHATATVPGLSTQGTPTGLYYGPPNATAETRVEALQRVLGPDHLHDIALYGGICPPATTGSAYDYLRDNGGIAPLGQVSHAMCLAGFQRPG
jgi:hypothetical protein